VTDFPIVEGHHPLTETWSIQLSGPFFHRTEHEDVCLWRPGLTIWLAVWGNDKAQTAAERLARIRSFTSADAYDRVEESEEQLLRFAYRLRERKQDKRVDAFYAYVIGASGHVQLAMYFEDEEQFELAQSLWRGVAEKHGEPLPGNTKDTKDTEENS